MAAAGKAAASAGKDEDVRKQLQGDPQLLALHTLFTRPDFISTATSHKVVWGHVKGYPWWPVRAASQLCRAQSVLLRWCLSRSASRQHVRDVAVRSYVGCIFAECTGQWTRAAARASERRGVLLLTTQSSSY